MRVNVTVLGRDVIFFLVAYAIAIGTAFLPGDLHAVRWGVAALLVAIYAVLRPSPLPRSGRGG